ncbi:MAG: phospho-N-acetylmuramoyl-pentapeptide-transferase [Clostridia bacterium]|nr:phospho-N-acetylmuramoyl-pentapeptide-transferase [Clostridia bacterium]
MEILLPILISFIICVCISPVLIPVLKKMKFGQQILEDGPTWHKSKSGTPTMGGISFITGIVISVVVCGAVFGFSIPAVLGISFAVLCGIIGFVDDYIKVCLKRNMGFNVLQKTICLALASAALIFCAVYFGVVDTTIAIPFTDIRFDLGFFYYILAFIAIFATVNSVNLTDGIDGLATSVTSVVMVFFALALFSTGNTGFAKLPLAVLGGLLGFLIFNIHPAKMFMGDTGSLFLGGMVSALAILMGNPLIILFAGLVYVFEALSVVIQVTSFKLTGKRVFKMTPIHHHFEQCGYSENKIVILFSVTTAVLCVIGFISL